MSELTLNIFTTAQQLDLETGQTLRLASLIKHKAKSHSNIEIYVLALQSASENVTCFKGCPVTYLKLKPIDLLLVTFSLCIGLPVTTALYQRCAARQIPGPRLYHLIRAYQYLSKNKSYQIDYCESLSDNFKLRSKIKSNSRMKNIFLRVESLLLQRLERRTIIREGPSQTDIIITKDQTLLSYGKALSVIPNAVERKYDSEPGSAGKIIDIIFIGDVNYDPNWQSLQLLMEIMCKFAINVVVIGRANSEKQNTLEQAGITVTGYLNDPSKYMRQAKHGWAYLITATGAQNKINDYISYGVKPICSELSAEPFSTSDFFDSLLVFKNTKEVLAFVETLKKDSLPR